MSIATCNASIWAHLCAFWRSVTLLFFVYRLQFVKSGGKAQVEDESAMLDRLYKRSAELHSKRASRQRGEVAALENAILRVRGSTSGIAQQVAAAGQIGQEQNRIVAGLKEGASPARRYGCRWLQAVGHRWYGIVVLLRTPNKTKCCRTAF